MILYRNCPLCNSTSLKGFAIDTQRKGPHISRVKCNSCELVFANPMADQKELLDYYQNYYEKDLYQAINYKEIVLKLFHHIQTLKESDLKKEAKQGIFKI
jgi:transcription elongation factor Elf1